MTEPTPTASSGNGQPDSDVVIDVRNLCHSFKGHRALWDVSLQVRTKSLHGFVGPNGAGKTTALKAICTLLRPQVGSIRVFGYNVIHDVNQVRRRIGFMPDHFSMYRQMTVYEYLDFFGAAYGLTLQQRTKVLADVLDLTDMAGRKDDFIQGLSRGMQQRVSLARVLVHDPDLLLLDEPASGLDPRARIELMEILRELRRMGKTIFISSHILSELAELCDSVTIIDRGRVKFSGAMDQLLAHGEDHPTYRLSLRKEQTDFVEKLRGLPGVVNVEQMEEAAEYRVSFDWTQTDNNGLLRSVMDAGGIVSAFREERRHLNDAFMDLTERGVR